jgi:hypothetical protein
VFQAIVKTDFRFKYHMDLIKDSRYCAMFSKHSVMFFKGVKSFLSINSFK